MIVTRTRTWEVEGDLFDVSMEGHTVHVHVVGTCTVDHCIVLFAYIQVHTCMKSCMHVDP